jgi:hypothetical protein
MSMEVGKEPIFIFPAGRPSNWGVNYDSDYAWAFPELLFTGF